MSLLSSGVEVENDQFLLRELRCQLLLVDGELGLAASMRLRLPVFVSLPHQVTKLGSIELKSTNGRLGRSRRRRSRAVTNGRLGRSSRRRSKTVSHVLRRAPGAG